MPDKNRSMNRSRRLFRRLAVTAVLTVLVYEMICFFVLPPVARSVLQNKAPELLHRSLTVGRIAFDPFLLRLQVFDLDLRGRDNEPFAGFSRLLVDVEASSVLKGALVIRQLHLEGPRLQVNRLTPDTYNFSDLLQGGGKPAEQKESAGQALFSVSDLAITGGTFVFEDRPAATTHRISDFAFSVPLVSNLPDAIESDVEPRISAVVNGVPFDVGGTTRPFTEQRSSRFRVQFGDLDIPYYLAYVPNPTALVLRSGRLDVDTALDFSFKGGKPSLAVDGSVTVRDLAVTDHDGKEYLGLPRLKVDLAPVNLLAGEARISAIDLSGLRLAVARTATNEILPLALLTPPKGSETPPEATAQASTTPPAAQETPAGEASAPSESTKTDPAFRLRVDALRLEGGQLTFKDDAVRPGFASTIAPFGLELNGFSTEPGTESSYALTLATEAGEAIATSGTAVLSPLAVKGSVELSGLALPRYAPYLAPFLLATIPSGTLGVTTGYAYTSETGQATLEGLTVTLDRVKVVDGESGEAMASLESLALTGGQFDLKGNSFAAGDLTLRGGKAFARRAKDGAINLTRIVRPAQPTATQDQPISKASGKDAPTPFTASVETIGIEQFDLTFEDLAPAAKATTRVQDLAASVHGFTTRPGATPRFAVSFNLNGKGRIKTEGQAGLDPFSLDAKASVADLALSPFQPYVAEHANLTLAGGLVTTNAEVKLTPTKEALAVSVKAAASLKDAKGLDADGKELFGWKTLKIPAIAYSSEKNSLAVQEVSLQSLVLNVAVDPEGNLNLLRIAKENPKPSAPPPSEAKPASAPLRIDLPTVTLAGSRVGFLDQTVTPNYSATLADINGTIKGLSSKDDSLAQLDLTARFNQDSPLTIKGTLNPLREKIFADIKVDFTNIEMSAVTPYFMRHVGYKIDKGKLNLDLRYLIDGKEINAENNAFLDQFTLGDEVESKEALDLPIRLALALLQNRRGEITLNIPVQGNTDDPEFSIAGVIFKVIVNLITKAITAPFALLGSLIPNWDETAAVPFAPGSTNLTPEGKEKLEPLAKALYDRPGLRMDIVGSSSPAADRVALLDKRLDLQVKTAKYRELAAKNPQTPPPEQLEIAPEEYDTHLRQAYLALYKGKEAGGAKVDLLPDPAKAKPEAREELIRQTEEAIQAKVEVNADDLRQLASARASAVHAFLVATGPVESTRLFLVEPKEAKDENAPPQVELVIK